jgi:hypothetical protein
MLWHTSSGPEMSTKRAHIVLPMDLVKEIDEIAGSRGRSAFLVDLARREIKRRRLLRVFERDEPIWRDEDHPELQQGAAEWVRKMRQESESRFESSEQRRKRN